MDLKWKINCKSSTSHVYKMLTSQKGRESFWAKSAPEINSEIHFLFPNGEQTVSQILKQVDGKELKILYFGSTVSFTMEEQENGETILEVNNSGVPENEFAEVNAGWVSVLLNLKSVADYGKDLRNHDPAKTWSQKFADN
jgi:hypothetical protein